MRVDSQRRTRKTTGHQRSLSEVSVGFTWTSGDVIEFLRWLRNFNTADRNIAQVTKLGPVSEQEISVGSASVSLLSLPTLNSVLGERRTID